MISKMEPVAMRAAAEGKRVGPYDILEKIGAGAMAEVFLARHRELDRVVALKVTHPMGRAEKALAGLRQEACMAALVGGPHVVPVYEVGASEGRVYLVMKPMLGGTFQDFLEALPFGAWHHPQRVVRALLPALRALARAHRHGIVHRDIKPANLLMDGLGRAHLADFGVAFRLQEAGDGAPPHPAAGTPAYMSPEMLGCGRARIGPPADVYAVGILLYSAFASRMPCDDPGLYGQMRWMFGGDPDPLRSHWADVPAELERIIERATQPDPADRHPDAGALADELERWLAAAPAAQAERGRS